MIPEDIALVARELGETALLFYRQGLEQAFVEKYIQTVNEEGISGYQAVLGLRLACRECTFLPTPAELFALIRREAIPLAPPDLSRPALAATVEHRWPTDDEMAENRRRIGEVLGRLVETIGEGRRHES